MNTMKTSNGCKKMRPRRGFMCQSPASTAICMSTGDPRSVVIIPRRTAADHGSGIDQHSLLLNKNNRHHSSSSSTTTTSSRCSRLPADSHQSHQHQPRQKFSTASILDSTHDHYNRRSLSAFIREDRGGHAIPPPLPPLPTLPSNVQVVVMRVSLHCQGCAGKVKKHISKMEGVTSFSIDLEMKRVTVMGHVSPVGVLESISKVKRAEFWTSSNTTTTC